MKYLKKLLLDMYRVAVVDGNLSNEEMAVLNNLCFKNNISIDDLTNITKNASLTEDVNPKDDESKRRYLFEIARIIIADGAIREEEIYLFNKIAQAIGVSRDLSAYREEIFKIVIREFIAKKEEELAALKNDLENEFSQKIQNAPSEKMIPESEHQKIVRNLIVGYEQGKYTYPYKKEARILVIGEVASTNEDILTHITEAFKENDLEIKTKNIKLLTQYDTISKEYPRVRQSVENGEYDYLIHGAHPHSLKGKSENTSWENYLKDTNTKIRGNYYGPVSLTQLKSYSKEFANDWIQN